MEHISLPGHIVVEPGNAPHESLISVQPCHPGFGTTLGNALRRVLLSSLPGAAITAFKVKGAPHEFTTLPGVFEDIVDISLNLKQVRVKVFTDEPTELTLHVTGERVVTAADIVSNSQVEIVNPDQIIATLTSPSAELDMRMIVERGRGYVPTEVREGKPLEVGMIAIDAVFSPIRNVGFRIENVRVGQMTNYENLLLNIETDGTITAKEAMQQAAAVLIDHYQFISNTLQGVATDTATEISDVAEVATDETDEDAPADEKPKRGRKKKAADADTDEAAA
jgi:DNA-directed RNA polymerase subunit alpha